MCLPLMASKRRHLLEQTAVPHERSADLQAQTWRWRKTGISRPNKEKEFVGIWQLGSANPRGAKKTQF